MKNKSTAFSLIEMLITIAIIGILSATIIVATQAVRQKAKDSRIKADMGELRLKAERDFVKKQSYDEFCQNVNLVLGGSNITDTDLADLVKDIQGNSTAENNLGDQKCYANGIIYAYSAKLNIDQTVCFDQSNAVKDGEIADSASAKCIPI